MEKEKVYKLKVVPHIHTYNVTLNGNQIANFTFSDEQLEIYKQSLEEKGYTVIIEQ